MCAAEHDVSASRVLGIPRVFHVVWVGPFCGPPQRPMDEAMVKTWQDVNPGWELKVWRPRDFDHTWKTLPFAARQRKPALAVDALRYEILARHGGVYVDTDFEALEPIEPLVKKVAAHVLGGREESAAASRDDVDMVLVCHEDPTVSLRQSDACSIGFIGATPGATVLTGAVEAIHKSMSGPIPRRASPADLCGTRFWRRCLGLSSPTGELHHSVVVIPSRALYPYRWDEKRPHPWPPFGAVAAHHWAASWWEGDGGERAEHQLAVRGDHREPAEHFTQ